MDLSNLDTRRASEEGAWLTLRHPATDRPILDESTGAPVRIKLLGKDSKAYQSRAMQLAQRHIGAGLGRKKVDLEAMSEEDTELLASATVAWEYIVVDHESLSCSTSNARTLYERFPWIKEQVQLFIGSREAFLGN